MVKTCYRSSSSCHIASHHLIVDGFFSIAACPEVFYSLRTKCMCVLSIRYGISMRTSGTVNPSWKCFILRFSFRLHSTLQDYNYICSVFATPLVYVFQKLRTIMTTITEQTLFRFRFALPCNDDCYSFKHSEVQPRAHTEHEAPHKTMSQQECEREKSEEIVTFVWHSLSKWDAKVKIASRFDFEFVYFVFEYSFGICGECVFSALPPRILTLQCTLN